MILEFHQKFTITPVAITILCKSPFLIIILIDHDKLNVRFEPPEDPVTMEPDIIALLAESV